MRVCVCGDDEELTGSALQVAKVYGVSVEQSKMGSMWSVISPMHSGVTGSMSPALLTRGKEAAAEPTKGTDSRSNETHTHTHTHTHVWRWWLFL